MAYLPSSPDQVNAANSSTAILESLTVTGASFSGSSLVLTGTWLTDVTRIGAFYNVTGFNTAGNNGYFVCTAQGANTITLTDASGVNTFDGAPIVARAFTGTAVDCTASAISSVTVFAFSDQSSSTNGMQLQWSQDNVNWSDHTQKMTNTASSSSVISDKVRARYFRVVYKNGIVVQGVFRLQTLVSSTNTSGTVRDLDTLVNGDDEAQVCRSVGTGRATPTGAFTDVVVDVYGNQQVGIGGGASDAFGRLRTAQPVILFDTQFQYDTQPLLFQTSVVGSGTVAKTANESSITLSTGGTTNTWGAINQTKRYLRYQPGKSQQIVMTGVLGAKTTNVRSRIGYFDANDGVYFEMDGTAGASVNQRSSTSGSPVNTSVTQANWNLDKMDGTGPSGVTLDFSKTQIFSIDLQWLGVGRVRFSFFVNNAWCICHQIYNANTVAVPYMNTANLPLRAEIFNTGTAGGTTTMKQICMTVCTEGGEEYPQAYTFAAGNKDTLVTGITTRVALTSVRAKTTAAPFGAGVLTNRSRMFVTSVDIFNNTGTIGGYWELIYNPTSLGGSPSFASVDPNSGMTVDVAATTVTGGTVIASGFVGAGHVTVQVPLTTNLPITLDFAGTTPDTMTLAITSQSTAIACAGTISWQEIR